MAERLDKSEGLNERNKHAMENPEEIAFMVDMSIHKSTDWEKALQLACQWRTRKPTL